MPRNKAQVIAKPAINEDVRSLVQQIRIFGSQINMSMGPQKLKGDALRLIDLCERLSASIGGAE